MNKRAVLYARVSGDDRSKDGRNLASQIEMGREYALAKGYTIIAELVEDDRGAPGESFNLEKLNQALEMARRNEFDVLVVRELDRFARSLAKQLIVEAEFKRAGVEIDYVLGEYPDTPEGNLMKNVRAVIAEYERLKITERNQRGLRNIVKSGQVMLHGDKPPYGYRTSEDGKMLVVHEPEAQIVRMMFDWYVYGDETGKKLSTPKIARRLSDLQIPTWHDIHQTGSKKEREWGQWSHGSVYKMLRNETYKGIWHYGRRNGKKGITNTREHWLAVQVPAIVSSRLWEQAQEQRLRNKKTAKRNVKYDYLMRYRLDCACGYSMLCYSTAYKRKIGDEGGYQYYRCSGSTGRNVRKCDMPVFRTDQVDATIWNWLRSWLMDPDRLREGLNQYQAERDKRNAPMRARLAVVDDLMAENLKKLAMLLDLYLGGSFDKTMLVERRTRLEETIAALEKERASLTATLEAGSLTDEQIETIYAFAAVVRDGLEEAEADFQGKMRIIELLDVRGVLAIEDDVRVVYLTSQIADLSGRENLLDCSHHSWE